MSTNNEKIRKNVSEDYARAVSRPNGGCCGAPVQKGVVAKLAGYTDEELAALPPEAVVNSFGCGNPLAFSEVRAGQVVLDLGSGAGIDLLLAARKVGRAGRVIGIDMTDEMIAKARENIAASGLSNVEVRKGIIEELPVETGSVDWVISNCVINLSPEKHRVFAEIARVLRPGGAMLVSDIVVKELPPELQEVRHLYSSCVAGAIGEEAYVEGLRKAGLVDVEIRERLVYEAVQLEAFIGSELKDSSSCCCGSSLGGLAKTWAPRLEGKIWSAKVFARKPA
ncbi:MAG: arsenite methyltransferase [Deltaproteobacteria bacterium]|nr:arsenite methyltransferase [Deltaproteobacteria bacterium]